MAEVRVLLSLPPELRVRGREEAVRWLLCVHSEEELRNWQYLNSVYGKKVKNTLFY